MYTLLTELNAMHSIASYLGLNVVHRTLTIMFNAAGAMGQSPSPANNLPASPVNTAPSSPGKPHALQFSSAELIGNVVDQRGTLPSVLITSLNRPTAHSCNTKQHLLHPAWTSQHCLALQRCISFQTQG